jgi:hypothetical protein
LLTGSTGLSIQIDATPVSILPISALVTEKLDLVENDLAGVLTCVSYGGIEKTHSDGFQHFFSNARTQSTCTAAAIAAGARGRDLWPALGVDFGAWMAVRPDM